MSTVIHVVSVPLEPQDASTAARLRTALDAMCEKDPTLGLEKGPLNEIILKGIGESHLDWVIRHLQNAPGIAFRVDAPEVQYRETITRAVDWSYTHKQRGPDHYAKLRIQLAPLTRGSGIETEIRCPSEEIPPHIPLPEFQHAIDIGIHAACQAGVVAGFPVTDLQVVVLDAGRHDGDSTAAAFEIAARLGLREALPRARPWLLEPMMVVVTLTPPDCLGDVIADLNKRRGEVQAMATHDAILSVTAMVPFANLLGYENDLRAMTRRRGACTMAFDHFEDVPPRTDGDDLFPMAAAMRA